MGRHSVDKKKKLHPDRPRRSRPPTTASGDDTLSSETTPHLTSPTLLSGASTSPSDTPPPPDPAPAAPGPPPAPPGPPGAPHDRHHPPPPGRHTAAQPGSRRHDGL